jgi:hypothetical protein
MFYVSVSVSGEGEAPIVKAYSRLILLILILLTLKLNSTKNVAETLITRIEVRIMRLKLKREKDDRITGVFKPPEIRTYLIIILVLYLV